MNAADKEGFVTILTGLAEYYEKTLSTSTIALYWEALKNYDLSSVEKAFENHIQNPDEAGRWMPKISDINQKLQGRTQDQASQAWAKVDRAVREIGCYVDVDFEDSITHRVICEMGGWISFSNKKEAEWAFVAKEFENRFRSYLLCPQSFESPAVLIGISNAENMTRGLPLQPPVRVQKINYARELLSNASSRS